MHQTITRAFLVLGASALLGLAATSAPPSPNADFGAWVEQQLSAHSEQLFGFTHPLEASAAGPFDNPDSTKALELAQGLTATLISSAVHASADQIAMWPNDDNPQYLFVCDEEV